MSSNKTIIPGMEEAYAEQSNFGKQNAKMQDGTCIPNPFGAIPPAPSVVSNQKPVIGFLYSISKSAAGEDWPLRIGSNSIGRSADCDVCLSESTVSEQHALLVVRQMKNPEKIIASICDARSTCGTMINGESLGFDQRECFNGDIITIGEHYDLYFILIDAKQIGLNVCRDFMGLHQQSNHYPSPAPGNNDILNYDPINANPQCGGTVGFNEPVENKPSNKPGGTIFM